MKVILWTFDPDRYGQTLLTIASVEFVLFLEIQKFETPPARKRKLDAI